MSIHRFMGTDIVDALLDVRKKKIVDLCTERLENGAGAYDLIEELTGGLREIGRGYKEIYFDAELMVAGWNAKKALEILKPLLQTQAHVSKSRDTGNGTGTGTGTGNGKGTGKVVIGTVKGDVHDIGKEIVSIMLTSEGFEIIDLGTNVSKEQFADAVRETGADILGMSALLTTTRGYMQEVIEYLKREGIRVKVMVGGGAVTEEFAEQIGADAYGMDAIDAIKKAKELLGVDGTGVR